MIFVDANCFLRFLTEPVTPEDRLDGQRAATLFALAKQGAVEVTTSDAILAEVVFILTNPRHYNGSRALAAASLKALLRPRAWRLPAKDVSLRALDLWTVHPELSYPDAIAAAYSDLRDYELATFDKALAQVPASPPTRSSESLSPRHGRRRTPSLRSARQRSHPTPDRRSWRPMLRPARGSALVHRPRRSAGPRPARFICP